MAILNMVGGGGGSLQSTDAILRVIAPAGSVVTISKGAVSKSDAGHENHDDATLYDYYFIIHASQFDGVNPWTVTATLGTQTMSDTIIINSADEYDMVISYTLWLIYNGVSQFGTITPLSWKTNSEASYSNLPSVSSGTGYIQIGFSSTGSNSGGGVGYFSDAKIDFSKYSKIHIVGSMRNPTSYVENTSCSAWTEVGGATQEVNRFLYSPVSQSTGSTSFVAYNTEIDISEVTSLGYFGFKAFRGTSTNNYTATRIQNCWFEV